MSAEPSHGQVFYIDTGQGQQVNAAYIGYRISSTTARKNLWAKLSSFEGGIVRLANPADARYRVGDVSAGGTEAAFFLLEANQPTVTDQSHLLTVYDADPNAGGSSLFSCTFNFVEVKETIKASANKVTDVSAVTVDELGGTVTVTVEGQTGTIGSGTSSPDGEVMWFSPAARSSWPSSSLVLESTSILTATNSSYNSNDKTATDTLIFSDPLTSLVTSGNSKRLYYRATYVFRVKGPVPSGTAILPIAQISSGTQIKHTDISSIPSPSSGAFSVSAPVGVEVTKSALTSKTDSDGDGKNEFQFTISLENTSSTNAANVDQVVDDFDAGLEFFAGFSPTFGGSALGTTPTLDADGNLVFQGPFSLAAGATADLVYKLEETASCTADFSYSNYAWGLVGSQKIGSSSSAIQGVNLSASSCSGTITAPNITQELAPKAVTHAASSVASTTATLNGLVNPTGTSRNVYFEWSQFSDLSGSTLVSLSDSSTGTSFEAVTTNLTGLLEGTTYYFRVQIGTVYGEILSFSTTPVVADPVVTTQPVTNIVTTNRAESVTFVGVFDANLTSSTPYFEWGSVGSTASCTAPPSTPTKLIVQEEINDTGTLGNVTLTTAFPTTLTTDVTSGLSANTYYCVRAGIEWTGGSSPAEGDWVLFQFSSSQTVTYNGNGNDGGTVPSSATVTIGNTHSVSSNTLTRNGWTFAGWNTSPTGAGTTYTSGNSITVNSSITLYALWTATVTYNAGTGGSSPPTDSRAYTAADIVTVKPPTGMTNSDAAKSFSIWQDGGGTDWSPGQQFSMPTSGNVTLTAQWVATYTVTYYANGGSDAPAATTHNSGSTVRVSSTEPTRSGYEFVRWTTAANGTGTPRAPTDTFTISSDVDLYAQWAEEFTITYTNTSGSGSPPSSQTFSSVNYPSLSAKPSGMDKSGFTFGGWKPTGGGSVIAAGTTYNTDADLTVDAFWYATVTYHANGADSGTVPTDNGQYEQGDSVTVRANTGTLARDGYTFAGWRTTPSGGSTYGATGFVTFSMPSSGDLTLYANWTPITYSITYNNNGGTGTAPNNQTLSYNGSVTLSSKPSGMNKSGFNFGGWNTQSDGQGTTLAAGSNYSTNSALALYARWVTNVTYNANSATSGTVPTDNTDYLAGATVTVSSNSGTLARTGFTFDGWNTAADGSGTDYADTGSVQFTITENTTLYAQWVSAAYTITYDGNSPTTGSAPGNQTASGGASITVPGNTGNLEKTGLLFGGWNTQSNGSGTTYPVGTTFAPPGNMTLYALWLTPYTVTYDPNGATGGSAPSNQTWGNGQTATVASNTGTLVRSGFLFGGWQTTTTGGTTYTAGSGTFTVTGNVTLYARWVTYSPGNSGGSSGGGKKTTPTVTPTPPILVTPRVVPTRPVVPAPQAGPQATPTPVTPPGQNTPGNGNGQENAGPTTPQPPQQSLAAPRSLLLNPGQGTIDLGGGIQTADEVSQGNPGNSGNQGNQGNGGNIGNSGGPGSTGNAQNAAPAGVPSLESARRTISELAGEQLGGFAPGSSTYIEIIGARTGARFVVTETEVVDSFALVRAMQTSIDAQRSNFFSIDTVQVANAPITPQPWTPDARDAANYLFTSSGLPEPTLLADLPVEQYTNWVFVETQADTYVPGSTVYLTLTSEPIVLAEAVVDRDGEVQISGTLPAELLTAGEHRVRIVGIRALDGASVGDDGEIVVSDALLEEIQRFDLGTQSTIAFFGSNPTGETHTALRVIPLVPVAPWWTLIFIGLGLILFGILRRWGPVRKRSQHTVAAIVVLSLASPAVIIGWLSTVTTVTWWGLGLGLIATALYWLIRPKRPDGIQSRTA